MGGHVVKVVKSGEVTLVFCDDYCRNKTPEEVKEILDRIAAIALPGLNPSSFQQLTAVAGGAKAVSPTVMKQST